MKYGFTSVKINVSVLLSFASFQRIVKIMWNCEFRRMATLLWLPKHDDTSTHDYCHWALPCPVLSYYSQEVKLPACADYLGFEIHDEGKLSKKLWGYNGWCNCMGPVGRWGSILLCGGSQSQTAACSLVHTPLRCLSLLCCAPDCWHQCSVCV